MNELTNNRATSARTGINIENRERATITGILRVESFDEHEVCAQTENSTLTLYGENLHIFKLDLDNGILVVNGFITGCEYTDINVKNGFFSKIFK